MLCINTFREEKKNIVKLWNNSTGKSFPPSHHRISSAAIFTTYATEHKTSLPDASGLEIAPRV